MSQRIGQLLYGSWGLLGFYRGIQYYNYNYEEDMKYYKNQTIYRKPEKFYISQLGHGCLGTVIYIIPFMCIFPVIKELYRLEINLRGLEEEKKKRYYYNLLF